MQSFLPYSIGHTNKLLNSVGRDCAKVWIPGGRIIKVLEAAYHKTQENSDLNKRKMYFSHSQIKSREAVQSWYNVPSSWGIQSSPILFLCHLIVQDGCSSSSHHIYIPVSRKLKGPIPFRNNSWIPHMTCLFTFSWPKINQVSSSLQRRWKMLSLFHMACAQKEFRGCMTGKKEKKMLGVNEQSSSMITQWRL